MFKKIFIIAFLFLPSVLLAQVTMTIPDPYDPTRTLPLDDSGRIDCNQSKLENSSTTACSKAKKFYTSQFADSDLRFSKMIDHIRPHPKSLISAFLTPQGVACDNNLSIENKKLCNLAKKIFSKMDKEESDLLIRELKPDLPPMMIVPLDGELNCSWSKLKKEQYEFCLEQNKFLSKMLFEQRLKHNERAVMLIQLMSSLQRMQRKCKCN